MSRMTPTRLLLLAIRAIGDVVLITPIIRQLRLAYPGVYLAALADGQSAKILHHNPHLDRVIEIDRRAAKQLSNIEQFNQWLQCIADIRQEQFDTVVDVFGGPRSAMLAWLSGASHRYGEESRKRVRGFLYSHSVQISRDGQHLIEQKLALIHPLVGNIEAHHVSLELFLESHETQRALALLATGQMTSQRMIGLVPGAGSPWRRWPPERFAELADFLIEYYHARIVLVGSPDDQGVCQEICECMNKQPLDLSGQTSLRELIAVLAQLDLVISNVTGPMHIASALAKPQVIGLYGAADTVQYAPWGSRAMMVTKGSREDAYWQKVNYEQDYQRLLEISVQDVRDAIVRLMTDWKP
ncbi:MAG: ADP-heptose--LPS heptosyltransferase [Nitrospirales bacterium]|nr:MAG: ADP-heptose--LPS heptosyltransferase [Nitrospirales bacterium]